MNKEDVKVWATVVTAVLAAVYTLEKVIDKGVALIARVKPVKKHAGVCVENDDTMKCKTS